MPKKSLTERFVQSVQPAKGQVDYYDDSPTGFTLRVSPAGKKTYCVTYRTKGGRKGRYSIGDADIVPLSDARKKAKEILLGVVNGADPSEGRRRLRMGDTFKDLAAKYIELHCEPELKPRSTLNHRRNIDSYLMPQWGHLKIADIKPSDITLLLMNIGAKRQAPILANRIRATISGIFMFALRQGLLATNPCVGLPKAYKESSRQRYLEEDEIVRFWKATEAESDLMRDIFRCLLLLGQRVGETKLMRWDDVSEDSWIIPASVAKNGREHLVPLPPLAQNIISNRKRDTHNDTPYVFMGRKNQPVTALQKAQERIAKRMGSKPWTIHDLRRTVGTHLEKLKVSEATIAAVLNHKKESRSRVTAIYTRHQYTAEKRQALALWASKVEEIVGAPAIDAVKGVA